MKLETVKIIDGNRRGFKIINKSDFDAKTQKPFKEKVARVPRKPKKAE